MAPGQHAEARGQPVRASGPGDLDLEGSEGWSGPGQRYDRLQSRAASNPVRMGGNFLVISSGNLSSQRSLIPRLRAEVGFVASVGKPQCPSSMASVSA